MSPPAPITKTGGPPGTHRSPADRRLRQGDYLGRTVNVAARIADYARQGEVLVQPGGRRAADGTAVAFNEIGPVDLKGLSEAVRLYVAERVTP